MQYRTFGKLDWKASVLGLGAMRLPVLAGDHAQIDEPKATRMIRYAIDHGVNYVDTAYGYHGGKSEGLLGRALQDGYRGRVKVATKMPSWLVKTPADLDRIFGEQLERLQADRIELYLLHGLGEETWRTMQEHKAIDWAERMMADGRIGHLGFSFHDRYEVFQEIVDAYDNWTFCQIQYNYMDEMEQAGVRGLKYAAGKGLAVVVMEPVRGGFLADPPPVIREMWDTAPRQRAPADWALQWVWNQPEVAVVLSGMSTMEQVQQNIASADHSTPGTLTAEDLALVARVREKYQEIRPIPCTDCKYCQPCPNGVNIPRILGIYNDMIAYNAPVRARASYGWLKEEERANVCTQCGECEKLCPQSIPIIEWLERAHAALA